MSSENYTNYDERAFKRVDTVVPRKIFIDEVSGSATVGVSQEQESSILSVVDNLKKYVVEIHGLFDMLAEKLNPILKSYPSTVEKVDEDEKFKVSSALRDELYDVTMRLDFLKNRIQHIHYAVDLPQ